MQWSQTSLISHTTAPCVWRCLPSWSLRHILSRYNRCGKPVTEGHPVTMVSKNIEVKLFTHGCWYSPCVRSQMLNIRWSNCTRVGCWLHFYPCSPIPLQNNASKLLLAIMESRHDSENAERILYNMRPKELVRATSFRSSRYCWVDVKWRCVFLQVEVIKKAYMQGEIEVEEPAEGEDGEEEHSASPRNVGHNIYILAHQVSRKPGEAPV